MKKQRNNKGFTLVELIVVMAIMAVLIGVLAPNVVKYVDRARESKDLQLVSTVYTALETSIVSAQAQGTVASFSCIIDDVDDVSATLKADILALLSDDMQSSSAIIGKCKSTRAKAAGNGIYVIYNSATGYIGAYIDTEAYTVPASPTAAGIETALVSAAVIGPASNQ